MAGSRTLTLQRKVLERLAAGPTHRVDLERHLLLDPVLRNRHLGKLLQDMRLAGMIECVGKGLWKIADGYEVCACCSGRGLLKKEG